MVFGHRRRFVIIHFSLFWWTVSVNGGCVYREKTLRSRNGELRSIWALLTLCRVDWALSRWNWTDNGPLLRPICCWVICVFSPRIASRHCVIRFATATASASVMGLVGYHWWSTSTVCSPLNHCEHHLIAEHLQFAGAVQNGGDPGQYGMQIYPPCGGSLASGDISSILVGSDLYDSNSFLAVRDALAGGDRNDWEQLGGSEIHNGDTWPGTFTLNLCLR